MGLDNIFTNGANFDKIVQWGANWENPIHVSKIVQQAHIDVNENGCMGSSSASKFNYNNLYDFSSNYFETLTLTSNQKQILFPGALYNSQGSPVSEVTFKANREFVYVIKTPTEILFIGRLA